MVRALLLAVIAFYPISEIVLAFVRRSRAGARSEDRGSMVVVWTANCAGVALAFLTAPIPAGRIPLTASEIHVAALVLMVGGLALRWTAILTLGKFFTVNVAVHDDHRVVDRGLYRWMRHPSYTGMLVAFLGFGVAFGSWISVLAMLLPIVSGVVFRVSREERALLESLGQEYAAYCARTKRFVPGVL